MRRLMLSVFLSCFVLALSVAYASHESNAIAPHASRKTAAASSVFKPLTLCATGEKVIFSCSIQKSAKLLSLCSSQQLDSHSGYVQYRFGRPGKVELEFPSDKQNTQSAFSYARYTRPLVTYLAVRFKRNDYEYSIHQDDNEEEKPPVMDSYLDIIPPGQDAKPLEMKCSKPVTGSLAHLEDIVPLTEEAPMEP